MATTIKNIEAKTFQGKVTGHTITLSDGTQGYLNGKGSSPDLKVGDEVSFSIEIKKNKKGGDYNLLTLQKITSQSGTAVSTPAQPATVSKPSLGSPDDKYFLDAKIQLRRDVLKTIGEVAATGKIEPKEIVDYFNTFYPAMDASIDDLKG